MRGQPEHAEEGPETDPHVLRHLRPGGAAQRRRVPQQLPLPPGYQFRVRYIFFFLSIYLYTCRQVGLVGGACEDVAQMFYRTSKYEKKDKLVSILNEEGRDKKERTLVFVRSKR